MKRLMFKAASALVGLSLGLSAFASPRLPISMAPTGQQVSSLRPVSGRIIIIIIVTRAAQAQSLEHVDQSAQFDRVN
jgi:hypothetical protein